MFAQKRVGLEGEPKTGEKKVVPCRAAAKWVEAYCTASASATVAVHWLIVKKVEG